MVRKVQCRQTKAMRVMKIVDKQCLSKQQRGCMGKFGLHSGPLFFSSFKGHQEATFSWLGVLGLEMSILWFGMVWWGTVLCFLALILMGEFLKDGLQNWVGMCWVMP